VVLVSGAPQWVGCFSPPGRRWLCRALLALPVHYVFALPALAPLLLFRQPVNTCPLPPCCRGTNSDLLGSPSTTPKLMWPDVDLVQLFAGCGISTNGKGAVRCAFGAALALTLPRPAYQACLHACHAARQLCTALLLAAQPEQPTPAMARYLNTAAPASTPMRCSPVTFFKALLCLPMPLHAGYCLGKGGAPIEVAAPPGSGSWVALSSASGYGACGITELFKGGAAPTGCCCSA